MESRNPKRKIRKTRKVLNQIRKRKLNNLNLNNAFQEENLKTRTKVAQPMNVPYVTSNRLTLGVQNYGNVVISETVMRNSVLEKTMLNSNQTPQDIAATQFNNLIINEMPSLTQNNIFENNGDHEASEQRFNTETSGSEYYDFFKKMIVPVKIPSPRKEVLHRKFQRRLRNFWTYINRSNVDEQLESESSSSSDKNDSLLDPQEYINYTYRNTVSNTDLSFNVISPNSQTSHVSDSNLRSVDSDPEDANSTSSAHLTIPSVIEFNALSDTPQCEYFPHKLNN